MSLVELVLAIVDVGLLLWIMQLKNRVRELELDIESRPPEPEGIGPREMRQLRNSLHELVREIEGFTEAQMKRIQTQMAAFHEVAGRMGPEAPASRPTEPAPPAPEREAPITARVVPLASKQYGGIHKDKDRIVELHRRGWTMEQIAEELRITRSEVQLVVNLS